MIEHTPGPLVVDQYEPYVRDGMAGLKVTFEDGQIRYIYLNPSSTGEDVEDEPNVFVYFGRTGDPATDTPCHWYSVSDEVEATGQEVTA